MQVKEIKELVPLSDVFELNQNSRYIILVKDYMNSEKLTLLRLMLQEQGIRAIIITAMSSIQLFDLGGE